MNINRRHFLFLLATTVGAFALDGCALAEQNTPTTTARKQKGESNYLLYLMSTKHWNPT
ncbi:hypothetical protein RintRC_3780 [Richelia intracellularis]|nr:hypothetical protein RintRC_3780 [Richelia intracellularis]